MNLGNGGWLIAFTIVAALLLTALNLPATIPDWLRWLRPDWGVLVCCYWGMRAPGRLGVVWSWCVGLFFDVLLGEPLGLHGIGFAGATWIAARYRARFAMYRLTQQIATVFLIAAGVAAVKALARLLVPDTEFVWNQMLAAVGAVLAYPFLYAVITPFAARQVRG